MDNIEVVKADIVEMDTDAVVNAANEGLWQGGGVCGAIFEAAGPAEMRAACEAIGHCATGDAVITPGFALKAKHVIHAVGPRWHGGGEGEPELLASCYTRSLDLARAAGCTSVAFPLISSGIFGYPKREAWRVALTACSEWVSAHCGRDGGDGDGDGGAREDGGARGRDGDRDHDMRIVFCVLGESSLELAESVMAEL